MHGILKPFISLISVILLTMPLLASAGDNAADFVIFKAIADKDTSRDCAQLGELRLYVINQHPSKAIDLSLDRYFSSIRQPGRSMFALESSHQMALSCNKVMDSEQHWVLIAAEFISHEMALKRYGKLYWRQ